MMRFVSFTAITTAMTWLGCATVFGQPVHTVVVEKAKLLNAPITITLVGTVEPIRRSKVASEMSGIVTAMPVRQGDFVNQGDILCRLDVIALKHQIAEAKASYLAKKASHTELLAGTRPQEIRRSKALLDETTAENERWAFEMERVKQLYSRSDANQKELSETRASFLSAQRRKIAAQASYDLAVAGPREEQITRAAYEAAQRKAVFDKLNGDLEKSVIRAPFSGHVITLNSEVGEWIPKGGPVLEMIDTKTVLIRVDMPESGYPYLKISDKAHVRIDALDKSFVGTIRHIVKQADTTSRTFPTEIEIANEQDQLGGGMFARATLIAGPKEKVIAVPKDAIVERNGITQVAVVQAGKDGAMIATLVTVHVGHDINDWVSITSANIKPGMKVITKGNEGIRPYPTPVVVVDKRGDPQGKPKAANIAQAHSISDMASATDADKQSKAGSR